MNTDDTDEDVHRLPRFHRFAAREVKNLWFLVIKAVIKAL
jgi:hypothetical protein